jgi:FAD/FMN-containing dehydrogenase
MLQHARQTEMNENSSFYRLQVSSHFHMMGAGLPQFTYGESKDNLVCIQAVLPDSKVFYGDYCRTYNEAAESAAKKIYEVSQG